MEDKAKQLIASIFNLDNPLMRASERVFDLCMLNILFVLSCLPLVTIGIAKMSLFTCIANLHRYGKSSPFKDYMTAFKANWKQGLQLGVVELLVTLICLFDLFFLMGQTGLLVQAVRVVSIGLLFLTAMTSLYLYPIAIRYEMSLRDMMAKSMILASLHFGKTLLMLVCLVGLGLVLIHSTITLLAGLSILLIIGWALLAYGNDFLVDKALRISVKTKE